MGDVDTSATWTPTLVTKFDSMFAGATDYNKPLKVWTVAAAVDAAGDVAFNNMFNGATKFKQNLCDWKVDGFRDDDGGDGMLTETNCPVIPPKSGDDTNNEAGSSM